MYVLQIDSRKDWVESNDTDQKLLHKTNVDIHSTSEEKCHFDVFQDNYGDDTRNISFLRKYDDHNHLYEMHSRIRDNETICSRFLLTMRNHDGDVHLLAPVQSLQGPFKIVR